MAKTLKYKGRADTRSIDADAWRSAGVENQNKVQWDSGNEFTAEVSNEAAAYLLDKYGKDFEEVDTSSADTKSTTKSTKGS